MASPPVEPLLAPAEEQEVEKKAAHDPRTVDGKPLYILVTIMEPELVEKDGEKFMSYVLSTESNHKSLPKKPTVVSRRFREFVWLRSQFKLDASKNERSVPELPPKTIFKSFSDKKFNDDRQRGLEQFIQRVVKDEAFQDENVLYQFLKSADLAKSVGYAV